MEESCAATGSVGMMVSDLSDPFDFRGPCEEERRHRGRLAKRSTLSAEKPHELWGTRRRMARLPGPCGFRDGFSEEGGIFCVHACASLRDNVYLCSSNVWASSASAQTQAPSNRSSIRPRHNSRDGQELAVQGDGLIRLKELQCHGLLAARERHRCEGIGNNGTDSGGLLSCGSSAATCQLH
jgi:hypothetical protein